MRKLIFGLIATVFLVSNVNAQVETSRPISGHFSVISILMDEGNAGCYSVLTTITFTDAGGTQTVMAQAIVKVGACGRFSSNDENVKCPDFEFKGDCFYNTKYETKNCIVDLLKVDAIYELYSQEKDRVLSQIKK